jgi:alpha-amylase/alpha-mannosidase (GH57 family)
MLTQLASESESLTRAKARLRAASPAQAQAILMEIGQIVQGITKEWQKEYAAEAYRQLNKLALEARTNPVMDVKNILNASFLIEKAHESEFQKEVYELDARYRGKLNFKYVGPLPPYNFVQVKMETANAN